jgi:hypothetical protein
MEQISRDSVWVGSSYGDAISLTVFISQVFVGFNYPGPKVRFNVRSIGFTKVETYFILQTLFFIHF